MGLGSIPAYLIVIVVNSDGKSCYLSYHASCDRGLYNKSILNLTVSLLAPTSVCLNQVDPKPGRISSCPDICMLKSSTNLRSVLPVTGAMSAWIR